MTQYKTIPASSELVIKKGDDGNSAVAAYAAIINREAQDGWKLHSFQSVPVTEQPGCIAGLLGSKSVTTYYNMLVFEKND